MSLAPRSYTRRLLTTLAVGLLVAGLFNTLINPLRVTPTPWSIDALDPCRVVEHYERTAKAGYVLADDWNVAILGSSRMDISTDPDIPAFAGLRAVNLALPGGKLAENIAMLRFTLANENVDLVVFGVDLVDLTVSPTPPRSDFYTSPLGPGGRGLDRKLQYLFSISFLKQSFIVLGRAFGDTPGEHTTKGHWSRPKPPSDQRLNAERGSFSQVFAFVRARQIGARIHPAKANMLNEIVQISRAKGVRLILVLPPNHAIFNASIHLLHDPDPVLRNERNFIANLVADDNARHPEGPASIVWDFDDFHPVNCEPIPYGSNATMDYWLDVTHCTAKTGELMAAAYMGMPGAFTENTYGRPLSPDSVDSRFRELSAGYERYAHENPAEIEWARAALERLQASASALILRTEE